MGSFNDLTHDPDDPHPVVRKALEETTIRYRQGPNGEPAQTRQNDYYLTLALFIDTPKDETTKTRLYFASDMVSQAPNRDVKTNAVLQNLKSIVKDDVENKTKTLENAFEHLEEFIETEIETTSTTKAEVVRETLDGVRQGQSYLVRWGNTREEAKEKYRDKGWGSHGL